MTARQISDLTMLIRKELAIRLAQRRRLDRKETTKRLYEEAIKRSEERIYSFIESMK